MHFSGLRAPVNGAAGANGGIGPAVRSGRRCLATTSLGKTWLGWVVIDGWCGKGYNEDMRSAIASTLAVAGPGRVIMTFLGLVALLVGAVVGFLAVRRVCRGGLLEKGETGSFTLEQLRQMHQQKQLSDEEYQALRGRIIQMNQDQ